MAQIRRLISSCVGSVARPCWISSQFLEESPEPSRLWSAELTAAWEEWLDGTEGAGDGRAASSSKRILSPR